MYGRTDNKRIKNWYVFVIFFFSILVLFISVVNIFFAFRLRGISSAAFWSMLIINLLLFTYSIVAVIWSSYKIFKESEQMCFPYPTLTPFVFSYPQSKQSPSEKLFLAKNF